MAIIRIAEFQGDTIVVHFGTEASGVNAYTFARSLMGFADTAYAVSASIDPGQEIEIVIEALAHGSVRSLVRRIKRDYGGVFSQGPIAIIFWGVVTNLITAQILSQDISPNITINTNEVIIVRGKDRIIVPRVVHEAAENAKKSPDVQKGLKRTFDPLREDQNVTGFGLSSSIEHVYPIVNIPRPDFVDFAERTSIIAETPTGRIRSETARLIILKAWVNHTNRKKWAFEWNGVPVSAPITDEDFWDRLEKREILIGNGDALDAEITFKQALDERLGVFVNDPKSFVISRVFRHVPRE